MTPDGVVESADPVPAWLSRNRREALAAGVSAEWGKSAAMVREYEAAWPTADPLGPQSGYPEWRALTSAPDTYMETAAPKGERKVLVTPSQALESRLRLCCARYRASRLGVGCAAMGVGLAELLSRF